jgi:hypothetical protein
VVPLRAPALKPTCWAGVWLCVYMRAVFSFKGAEPPLDPLTKERENKGPHSGPKSGVIKGVPLICDSFTGQIWGLNFLSSACSLAPLCKAAKIEKPWFLVVLVRL